jgi:hypothetical protein
VKRTTLEGFLVAENVIRGQIVSSKKNESEAAGIVENMVTKPVSTVYIEESGTLAPVRVGLRMFGESATVSGSLETILKTGQEWGIFTVGGAENDSSCGSWTKLMVNLEKLCWP